MPAKLRERIQQLWLLNKRNRILMLVGTVTLSVVLLCGCLNLVGTAVGNWLFASVSANPNARPTFPAGTGVANTNPTFPVPQPTVYNFPNQHGGTPVGSSGTPAPTPTASPTPLFQPPGDGSVVSFRLGPDPQAFRAGRTNTLTLQGPPGVVVGVSFFFFGYNKCLQGSAPNDPVTLDANGQATFSCDLPDTLRGAVGGIQLMPNVGPPTNIFNIPVK
ncbi:MAG TPA: hypothetical protein VH540_03915 [Ktedonobacterales bacterium]|jgi:hypothetical protein